MEMHQLRSRYVPATLPDLQNGNVNFRQDHVTVWRWVQRYAPKMERRLRSRLKPTNDSWRVGEPYIRTQYAFRAWKAGQHDEIT
jgi:transposase-like protein